VSLGGVLGIIGNPSMRRGAQAWFRGILTHGEKVMDF